MFGRPIKETMQIDSRRGAGMVPIIVELCVEYIRKHGIFLPDSFYKITFETFCILVYFNLFELTLLY